MALAEQKCRPVEAGTPPLSRQQAEEPSGETPQWTLKQRVIERGFEFKSFQQAMDFVSKVAGVAEEEDHHPDIWISYNKVRLQLSTHKIGGLSKNDFILAAKIDRLL